VEVLLDASPPRTSAKKTRGNIRNLLFLIKSYLLRKNLDIVEVISFVRVDPPGLASRYI
jgi:hypothetical protein